MLLSLVVALGVLGLLNAAGLIVILRRRVAADGPRRRIKLVFVKCARGHEGYMEFADAHGVVPERQLVEIEVLECPACAVTAHHWNLRREPRRETSTARPHRQERMPASERIA